MYKVTFIRITDKGPQPMSVTSPSLAAAKTVHDALILAGVHARLWNGNEVMIPHTKIVPAL